MTAARPGRPRLEIQAPGPYLRSQRKAYKLTLEDVAIVSGYSTTYLSKIEREVLTAPHATIVRITRAIERRGGKQVRLARRQASSQRAQADVDSRDRSA